MDGADDDLVGGVLREQPADECFGVGVLFDAPFLEAIEFLARLAVQVFAVDDEEAFFDVRIRLQERGSLEARERLAAAGGVPDVAVAEVFLDALDDVFDGVDLVRPHHHQLLFAGDEDHVAADHPRERALFEELVGEFIHPLDLAIVGSGKLVNGQVTLVRVEAEVPGVVVGEVVGAVAVGDDEKLDEAKQRAHIAVAGVVLVLDDLLDGAAGIDAEAFQFNLRNRYAVDEQDDVVTVVAVVRVDAELADDFERVLAPVGDIDERVIQWRAVVAGEAVAIAQGVGRGKDVGRDDLVEQADELAFGQLDVIQCLEASAEVLLQGGAIADVRAKFVLEVAKLLDKLAFKFAFGHFHCNLRIVLRLSANAVKGLVYSFSANSTGSNAQSASFQEKLRRRSVPSIRMRGR